MNIEMTDNIIDEPIEYWVSHTHPNTQTKLLVFGKEYLRYATWKKKYQFDIYQQDEPFNTFHEILQDKFDGDLKEAMNKFLIPEFIKTTLRDMVDWIQELGIECNYDIELLCVMKLFIMNCDLDELKELLELDLPSLK